MLVSGINKSINKKNWLLGFIVFGLFVVLIFLVIGNLELNSKREKLQSELEVLEGKIAELGEEKEGLESKIFQGPGLEHLERVAREELNLKREGESVVAFPLAENPQEKPKDLEQQTLWQKIMEKIR